MYSFLRDCQHDKDFVWRLILNSVRFTLERARGGVGDWELWKTGMLRLDLSPLISLHVWDMRFREQHVTLVHDHPWHLHSLVIAGEIANHRYHTNAEHRLRDGDPYDRQRLVCGAGACTLSEPEPLTLYNAPVEVYRPGQCYHQHKSEIHSTFAQDGSVTLVERALDGDRDSAHVYMPRGSKWGDAAPRRATLEQVRKIATRSLLWFA